MASSPTHQCTPSGGSGSTQANFADMHATAGRLDDSSGDAGGLCGGVARIGASVPPGSAILSPGSALKIAELVTGLTFGLGGLSLRMGFVASSLRWSARAYELTDAAQRQAFAALNVATTPGRLATDALISGTTATLTTSAGHVAHDLLARKDSGGISAWTSSFAHTMDGKVRDDPALTDGLIPWVRLGVDAIGASGLTRAVVGSAPPRDFDGQVGWILASGRTLGYFNDTLPLSVRASGSRTDAARSRQLADVVEDAADVEHRSNKDSSVLRVRRVVDPHGIGSWVVSIPGTTHWSANTDHGPSDATANLATMAGVPSSLYPAIDSALAAAMKESGVAAGTEPVLLAGHSQAGIVAARLAADTHFRTKYDVREVVTDGAPIGRIKIPGDVNVLSIEDVHDPVPRLDGVPNPDAINRVNVACEPPRGERLQSSLDAHDASRYTRSARELTEDRGGQLSQWYQRNHRFLDGRETVYDFQLRRD